MPWDRYLSLQGSVCFLRWGMEQNGKPHSWGLSRHVGANVGFMWNSQDCNCTAHGIASRGIHWVNKRRGRNLISGYVLELDSDWKLTAIMQGVVMTVQGYREKIEPMVPLIFLEFVIFQISDLASKNGYRDLESNGKWIPQGAVKISNADFSDFNGKLLD